MLVSIRYMLNLDSAYKDLNTFNLITNLHHFYSKEFSFKTNFAPLGRIELPSSVSKTGTLSVKLQGHTRGRIIPRMADITQRIDELKNEIRETPYHKGTERHIGLLRARIAKLEDEQFVRSSHGKGGGGGGFAIKKTGDATIVLVGAPSVGKSTILNALTNAQSTVAPYAFTTVTVIPGMMKYKSAYIQILDVPGLIEGASKGKGRGREVLSVVRGSDLLVFITEVGKESHFEKMESELTEAGIRINNQRPKIRIEKKLKGGLEIRKNVAQDVEIALGVAFHIHRRERRL